MIHIPSKPGDKIVITQAYLDWVTQEIAGHKSKFSVGDVLRIAKVDGWIVYALSSKNDNGQQDGTWDSFFGEEEIYRFQLRIRADQLEAIHRDNDPDDTPSEHTHPDRRGRR